MERNLWGNLDAIVNEINNPKDILVEQAEYLKESLNGLVRCKVMREHLSNEWIQFYGKLDVICDFTFSFKILSDYVENYEYEICRLTYGIKMYPLAISFGTGIAEELEEMFIIVDGDTIIVDGEENLFNVLQKILSSNEVHQVLKGLISIAKKESGLRDLPF